MKSIKKYLYYKYYEDFRILKDRIKIFFETLLTPSLKESTFEKHRGLGFYEGNIKGDEVFDTLIEIIKDSTLTDERKEFLAVRLIEKHTTKRNLSTGYYMSMSIEIELLADIEKLQDKLNNYE